MGSLMSSAIPARPREKRAGPDDAFAEVGQTVRDHPGTAGLAATVGGGLGAAGQVLVPGALMGLGYGAAKGRPFTGTARGAGRGALTAGGAGLGASAGLLGGAAAGLTPQQALLAALAGGAGGGVLGWKGADKLMGRKMEEKRGGLEDAFAGAVQDMNAQQIKADALGDVKNLGLTALGVGAAGRGTLGLLRLLRAGRAKKTRSGPAHLPIPFPTEAKMAAEKRAAGEQLGLGIGLPALAGMIGGDRDRSLAERGVRASTRTAGGVLGGAAGAGAGGGIGAVLGSLLARKAGIKPGAVLGGLAGVVPGVVGGDKYVGKPVANLITTGQERLLPRPPKTAFDLGSAAAGDFAASKSGIPWYGPAMLGTGLAGLGLGWKGMDKVLETRRKKQMKDEIEGARSEFQAALLGQYSNPVKMHPELSKTSADNTMAEVGRRLDEVFIKFAVAVPTAFPVPSEKRAVDWSSQIFASAQALMPSIREKRAIDWLNLAGQAAGGYGMYAGLSGLLTGAMVYDKVNKRSRRAILEKALQKRQRRQFMQSPTEIYAEPVPMPSPESAPAIR